MAFNDWAKIYFPISVEEGSDSLYTAIALSILKYSGSDPQTLLKYNLERKPNTKVLINVDGVKNEQMLYDCSHCHLCEWAKKQHRLLNPDMYPTNHAIPFCDCCPLPLKCGKSYSSAWYHFMETDDTEPLIQALSKALFDNNIEDLVKKEHLALPELHPFDPPKV